MPNRLINETSPYLLQHAHNPVDWYSWGEEALGRAKLEDKPILLSVGYSACHWCHVMEKESFEDSKIAALMNESFVCIKVDREERPDIDSLYMTAVQAMTGRGGWPMTVFLTPDGKPFYGGTYFPPEDRHGIPGFPRVVQAMADAYRQNRSEVLLSTDKLLQQMRQGSAGFRSLDPLTADDLTQAYRGIAEQFDDRYGGMGTEPKFPQPMTYEFLLRHYLRTEDPHALEMVELTLDRMARGGIYDQLGGGFHRYSTDMYWLVPHFEKMLYDNALLVRLYLHAFQVTGKPLYQQVVEETLDYVVREMTDPSGGFYSAQDADSEGIEGKYFVWRPEEVVQVLGKADGEIFNDHFGVTLVGNFEGLSILSVVEGPPQQSDMTEDDLSELLGRSRATLLEVRDRRVRPARDEKVLTAWNGLMLSAFAEAGAVLGRDDYTAVAESAAAFLLDHLREDGRLLRSYKDGTAKLKGYLEDYAFLIAGLISVHEATFGGRWLREAVDLGRSMVELFWDEPSAQFYDTGGDHEALVLRPRDISDNAIPAGSSMAADVLLRLSVITGDSEYQRLASTALRSARELMTRFPTSAGQWLCALDFYLSTAKEVAIIGDRAQSDTQALASEVYRHYMPNRVFLGAGMGDDALRELPLMEGREKIDGRATAYVCENYVCQLPTTDTATLAKQLVE